MHALSLTTFLPLFGALALLFVPRQKDQLIRIVAALASGLTLLASLWLWIHFDPSLAEPQFIEKFSWIPALHISYFLGVDGLSLPMVLLTTLLSFLALLSAFRIEMRVKEFFIIFLALETAMLGVFMALDVFLFYVFWEATLVPIYFLVGMWGGPRKEYAAIKFLLFTMAGSVLMLIAILGLYFSAQPHTFDYSQLMAQGAALSVHLQLWIFLGLVIGMAVKIPAFPLHTWLPLAHVEAPTPVSVILAGVLLKMGSYALLRFGLVLLPGAAKEAASWLALIAVINIVYGALCSLAQKDIKRMVAYSSVNHMGYVLLGLAARSVVGFNGAVLQMVNHGIITGALFLLVGILYERAHTRDMDQFGGLGSQVPVLTGFVTFTAFASLGLPLLSGFVGELLCFLAAFEVPAFRVMTGVSLLGLLITAAFFLLFLKRVFMGPPTERWQRMPDMTPREILTVAPLILLIVGLGIFPNLVLGPANATLTHLAEIVRQP